MRIQALIPSALAVALCLSAGAQAKPAPLTLAQALRQARANSPVFAAAVSAAGVAKAAVTQARAGLLPGLDFNNSYIYTQGSRYIANNGVHEYLSQGSVLESVNFGSAAGLHQAQAAAAVAKASEQIAARGLDATVTADYYTLLAAGHELTTAQQVLADAEKYYRISQELEQGGEVAHSDVIKAELEVATRRQGVSEARLAGEKARLALAVLLYPDFNQQFTLVDDLNQPPPLPALSRLQALAHAHNPAVAAASEDLRAAQAGVAVARAGLLPGLTLAYTYGLDAAAFALREPPDLGPGLPSGQPTLGSSATATLDIPLFHWGARRATLQQSQFVVQKAASQLRYVRRAFAADLVGTYDEASTANRELTTLAHSRQLAAESLRLSALRYRDGEATIVELVDAENANAAARDAYDAGLVRYRVALAQLQTLSGPF
ncbi:MAG: TolC family protein [Terriglobales bacterium]